MQSGVEVEAQDISAQRKQWAEDIARILWGSDLNALPMHRQIACHGIAHYSERLLNGLEHSTRDEAGNK
jgi:hypothetical protein